METKGTSVLRILIIGLLSLTVVAGLVYLAYSYGAQTGQPTEVPFGDEFAETDADYQQAMQDLTDQGPSGEDSPWLTYTNEQHGFTFDFPVTVFVEVTDGINLPLVFMDKELIIIPGAYGGPLTPVEIRTSPLIENTTVEERANLLKDTYDPATYQEKTLPNQLTGKWQTGICIGFGCDNQQIDNLILEGPNGLIEITFIPGMGFEQDLFERILAGFRFIN